MDSMQNQQQKLSKLAIQLQSSEDRQRYIKVIEMSNMIQCKLESLQEDTLFKSKSSRQIYLDRRASAWSLSQDILSHRSSAISDNTTIVAGSHCSDYHAFKPYHEIPIEVSSCYSHSGLIYKTLDRATSMEFHNRSLCRKHNRPVRSEEISQHTKVISIGKKQKQISFSPLPPRQSNSSVDSDDESEHPATVHIAIRKNASLYKLPHKSSRTTLVTYTQKMNDSSIELVPPKSLSNTPQEGCSNTGPYLEADVGPYISRVYMRSKGIKGLFKRSYQLNQYTVTNAILFRFFKKAINLQNGKSKLLLKLTTLPVDENTPEQQKRFGITFHCKVNPEPLIGHQQCNATMKCAVAPDPLVREALATWINSQNEQTKEAMPSISKADDILRDGRKLYVIYDTNLFKV